MVERRKYRRFEIPGGSVKTGKFSGFSIFKPVSAARPLLNICIGGLNFLGEKEFRTGEDLLLEIHVPDENIFKVRSKVIWSNPVPISSERLTGLEFFPFIDDRNLNPPEVMTILRRLYARYTDT